MKRFIVLVLVLVSAVGCSSSWLPKTPGAKRSEELRRLEERVLELQRQSRMAEVEIERLRRQIAELEGSPSAASAASAAPAPLPDAGAQARDPEDPPAAPAETSPPDREGIAFDRPADQWRVESEELPPPVDPVAAPEPSAPPVPTGADSSNAQALYDRGYTFYHQGRLVDAESAFQQFLQAHPGSDLADNAQFWIGAARFQRGDIAGALAAFRETVARFPEGNKVADATLKSGECLERLGDSEEARRVYREVIDRFPTTAAAALARERLDALP